MIGASATPRCTSDSTTRPQLKRESNTTEYEKKLAAYREMLREVVDKCHDLSTLDLVYKIIMTS